jgi:hypothetical protein
MATFNLAVTYPDGQQTRILNALKARATTEAVPAPTNAQAIEWFRQAVLASLRDVVLMHERNAAITAAAATVTQTDVT